MKHRYSKMLKILICIVLIVVFTVAFNQNSEIEDYAYAIAIGIDNGENNNLEVTIQFAKAVNLSEGSSSEPQPSIIKTVEASSIDSAFNLINSSINKQINLSHCKTVVISEEFAKNGASEVLYTLINDVQVRPDVSIVISRCNSDYFIANSKPVLENIVSKYYEIAPSSSQYTGYTSYVKIVDFFNAFTSNTCEPYAILGGINTQVQKTSSSNLSNIEKDSNVIAGETPISKNPSSEYLGLAIFKNDKLVGEISAIDTLCHLIIINKLESGVITIPNPLDQNSSIDLSIYKQKNTKKNVEFVNNSPYITLDIAINARILSLNNYSQNLTQENINKLQEAINLYLKDNISRYLYKTTLDFNSDVCCFGNYAICRFKTQDDLNNYNWKDNYKNSFFKVNVSSSVKSGQLLTQD